METETAEQFATRLKPDSSEIAHKVIKTKMWDTSKNVIIVFYSVINKNNTEMKYDGQSSNIFVGYLFMQKEGLEYQKILIDTLEEFNNQKIEEIFFCNADNDETQELAVLLSSEMNPWTSKCSGTVYNTYFYNNPGSFVTLEKTELFKDLQSKFYGCDCDCKYDYHENAKFKTVTEIKNELMRLGYN